METLRFADIIGPIMVGPSSSHTAGALRIAHMARSLMAAPPVQARFTLYGSFAHTKSGHGTDKALVAGILGFSPDDLEIRNSFEHAHKNGMFFSFTCDEDTAVEHPNTVDIHLEDSNQATLDVRGISIGGGAATIVRIDGIDVDITGEHTSIVVRQRDEKGVLAHIAGCLSTYEINIATTRMYRTRRGAVAYTIMEVDSDVPPAVKAALEEHAAIQEVRLVMADKAAPLTSTDGGETANTEAIPTSLEQAEKQLALCDFTTGAGLLERTEQYHCSIATMFLGREQAISILNNQPCIAETYAGRVLEVMRTSATQPLHHPTTSMGGLIGGEARAFHASRASGNVVTDSITGAAAEYALAVLETNASMGRIVAAPTAGSSGVLPAVLLALQDERGLSDETLRQGLLCAGAVGYLISRNATVSGAEGGCQAEIGAAASMAAAAAVEMMGGTPKQALNAASNALISLMGLVCDPIGGLVEVPCQTRNATAAAIALVCAQIALAGVGNLVNFDETVDALYAVGRALPFELRESALGGLAATPSACAWCAGCA